jgi:MFS family permease
VFSIDLTPLKIYRNYRWLYLGQMISFMGSMITYVAIPFQMYQLTQSTFYVGLLGVVQLVPLVLSGIWGGALADSLNRRKLAIMMAAASATGNLLLMLFTLSGSTNHYWLFLLSGLMAIGKGLERPAMEALTQQLVELKDLPKVSTLQSFKNTSGLILGPALGGILISNVGIAATYFADFLTYLLSIICLWQLKDIPELKFRKKVSFAAIAEGFRYAWSRPDLLGTYLVDMVAMTFAYPNPLFPAIAMSLGDASKLGWLYSAPAVGAMLATLTSGWTHRAIYHGRIIAITALLWCVGIFAFGLSTNFYLALIFLGLAGGVDMISGIFRATIWNETIPQEYRGRLASVEMISYSSGPLLGNTFMGALADEVGMASALSWGAVAGSISVIILSLGLKAFWNYRAQR